MAALRKALYLCIALCIFSAFCSACSGAPAAPAPGQTADTPAPEITPAATHTPIPRITPAPVEETPVPAGEPYDQSYDFVACQNGAEQQDVKHTWKVNSPAETPDPAWTGEWDGDTVTYTEIICNHKA